MTRPVVLHLVRHAKAGSRSAWRGDDFERPLVEKGEGQAEALAAALKTAGIDRVLSSPAVRCRQTVAPLARTLGTAVEDDVVLAEGGPLAPLLDLLHGLDGDTALCAHGDLIPEVLEHLAADGMPVDAPIRAQKASVWRLERRDGRFVEGRYTPPP